MSSLIRASWLLVVLLVFWNGASCQDEDESSPTRPGNLAATAMQLVQEARRLNWNPLQMCWMRISEEVREECDGGISGVRDLSCISPGLLTNAASCLQSELMSNGDNIRQLVMNVMPRIPQMPGLMQ